MNDKWLSCGSTIIVVVIVINPSKDCDCEKRRSFGTYKLHGDFNVQNVPQTLPDQNPLFRRSKHYFFNSLEFNTEKIIAII